MPKSPAVAKPGMGPRTASRKSAHSTPANHTLASHEPLAPNARARQGFFSGRWFSFQAALAGVAYTLRTQPNAWIELTAAAVVTLAGWWFAISALEWAILGVTVLGVLALECVNTAIEAVVDLVSPQVHPLAKIAKDAAAGALVMAVLGSLIVALAIFGPRVVALLT